MAKTTTVTGRRRTISSGNEYNFSFGLTGCYKPPHSYRIGGSSFYLIYEGEREIRLSTGYSGQEILEFNVILSGDCQERFDCLNGACIDQEIYATPGLYPTKADCEQACSSGCGGKCLSYSEWNKINDLANKLKSKNCS